VLDCGRFQAPPSGVLTLPSISIEYDVERFNSFELLCGERLADSLFWASRSGRRVRALEVEKASMDFGEF
jgi:hypothetical protein